MIGLILVGPQNRELLNGVILWYPINSIKLRGNMEINLDYRRQNYYPI